MCCNVFSPSLSSETYRCRLVTPCDCWEKQWPLTKKQTNYLLSRGYLLVSVVEYRKRRCPCRSQNRELRAAWRDDRAQHSKPLWEESPPCVRRNDRLGSKEISIEILHSSICYPIHTDWKAHRDETLHCSAGYSTFLAKLPDGSQSRTSSTHRETRSRPCSLETSRNPIRITPVIVILET